MGEAVEGECYVMAVWAGVMEMFVEEFFSTTPEEDSEEDVLGLTYLLKRMRDGMIKEMDGEEEIITTELRRLTQIVKGDKRQIPALEAQIYECIDNLEAVKNIGRPGIMKVLSAIQEDMVHRMRKVYEQKGWRVETDKMVEFYSLLHVN